MNDRGKLKLLPSLPGFNYNDNFRRTNFHKPQHFDKIHDGVYYLADKPRFSNLRYPPIYATEQNRVLPTWIAFDRQTLVFKAYFEEEVRDGSWTSTRLRMVDIYFFLEDETIKVSEPFVSNSGMEQGVLVRRQKVPITNESRFLNISDLNIGKEARIFGRVYHIFDCDKFTRNFLTRLGIPVPNPLPNPLDSSAEKTKDDAVQKKVSSKDDPLGRFLKYDRQILRFYGYWDDRESPFGRIHDLELYYYLVDNTIEVKEISTQSLPNDYANMFMRKTKVPKIFTSLNPIGADEPFTVLNIMEKAHPRAKNYFVLDTLNTGKTETNYYTEIDFFIGAQINIFGRKVVITNLDPFTKEYYRKKYGIEEFTPLSRPDQHEDSKPVERYIPPYNGFGTYEDSLGNCFTIIPKPPKINFIKFHRFGDHVLRFRAKMISKKAEDSEREFIIRFFLMDNTISIFELSSEKSGFSRHLFQNRAQVLLPEQEILSSEKPKYYDKNYFYIGATLNLNGFIFELVSADLYAIRYMENNPGEFPKSNAKLIMQKLREALKRVYKQFIQEYSPSGNEENPVWDAEKLRNACKRYLGDNITEHEIITIARKYSSREKKEFKTREYVRALVHNELNRFLWNELDRLRGNILHFDQHRSGFLTRKQLYAVLRGNRIPLNLELLNSMLDHINKNDEGKLDCQDLLNFVNVKIDPLLPVPPVNIKTALWWASEKEPDCGTGIDWRAFLKDLDLEDEEGSIQECSTKIE